MCARRLAGRRVRGEADHVVVLLRILVDDADARSRGEVVELVEEHFLPGFIELRSGVGSSAEPRERRPLLRVQHLLFALAHVAFVRRPGW